MMLGPVKGPPETRYLGTADARDSLRDKDRVRHASLNASLLSRHRQKSIKYWCYLGPVLLILDIILSGLLSFEKNPTSPCHYS